MFEKGYVIYVQTKKGEMGFLKKGNLSGYYISASWLVEDLKDALVLPTLKAAEARTANVLEPQKEYIEYMEIMRFDGEKVYTSEDVEEVIEGFEF